MTRVRNNSAKDIHIWLRSETKIGEYRAPITPDTAADLISKGFKITVEKSDSRCFTDAEYMNVGCELVDFGSWINAPLDAYIVGLKELPDVEILKHRHIYFAHCYKGQHGSSHLLNKFKIGGGIIYDIEYLTDDNNQRLASFGKSAGISGTIIGILAWLKQISNQELKTLKPIYDINQIITHIKDQLANIIELPNILIIAPYGRVGSGARYILDVLQLKYTIWTRNDTSNYDNMISILDYEIVINCINLRGDIRPFITMDMLNYPRKLSICVDISCDYTNPFNPIAIYSSGTSFDKPLLNICNNPRLDIISIDNLPSLIPIESSHDFAKQFVKCLYMLPNDPNNIWHRTESIFNDHIDLLDEN